MLFLYIIKFYGPIRAVKIVQFYKNMSHGKKEKKEEKERER